MKKLITWCKSHRTLAFICAMIVTGIVLALIFSLSPIAGGMYKKSTFFGFVFLGFWDAIWVVLAIKVNHWFQQYLLRK